MKRSLRYLGVALSAAVVVLAGGSVPAQALTSCSLATPCLPEDASFSSLLPAGGYAQFVGSSSGLAILYAQNAGGSSLTDTSAVTGVYTGSGGRASGVYGLVDVSSADNVAGVYGRLEKLSPGANSAGVRGESSSQTGIGYGVWGGHSSTNGTAPGVLGNTASDDANAIGVQGVILATNTGAGSKGVWGYNAGTGANGYGVFGEQQGSGAGVVGVTPSGFGTFGVATSSTGVGVAGYSPSPGYAGYFAGNVFVQGTLSKSAGAFRIDHPLDPAHKYLQHSFVESPDMKNVYDGVVTTNRKGFATVRLPRYFGALNRSFRYQLTLLGKEAWGAQAIVWDKIRRNRFVIRSKPRVEVSWQVTGIRKDAYANAHRIRPEIAKPAGEQGKYLHPELYGKPRSQSVLSLPRMRVAKSGR